MSILKAGKSKTNDHSQNLILSVTQGGLWFISHPAQKIFFQTEYFLRESLKLVYKEVDFPCIISKSISGSIVVSLYNIMLLGVELEPVDQISKSVLYSIINLYVRVRSFSLAKDIITCHKILIKKSKKSVEVAMNKKKLMEDKIKQILFNVNKYTTSYSYGR